MTEPPAHPHRILLVDDDADLAEVASESLRRAGYEVAVASNGREALAMLHTAGDWHLLLLDLMMPVMNGWELRAAQQRDPRLREVPVLAFSGGAQIEEAAHDIGAVGFLRKPAGRSELLSAVAEACARGPQRG